MPTPNCFKPKNLHFWNIAIHKFKDGLRIFNPDKKYSIIERNQRAKNLELVLNSLLRHDFIAIS